MASFFGFCNFQKPGKGVSKNEPLKNRFFLFFELYFRNFFRLILLNMLYMIACIPVITFGPATTALLKLTSDMVERKPVFIWHDFWSNFGKNFKSSFLWGLLEVFIGVGLLYSLWFFPANFSSGNFIIYLGAFASIIFSIIFLFAFFFSWLLSAKVAINGFAMLKNSLILSVMSFKANLIVAAFLIVFGLLFFITFPLCAPVLLFFPMSTLGFMISYLYFPYVYMHIIKPYYEQSGEEDPYAVQSDDEDEYEYEYVYEDEDGNVIDVATEAKQESLFTDAPELEKVSNIPVAQPSKKTKTIK